MATQLDRVSPITLYNMKRQYGAAIVIHKLISSTTDVRTGVKNITETLYPVARAVIFPEGYSRKKLPRFTMENRKWQAGGSSDIGQREILIDRKDTIGLTDLSTDDWIVYKGKKYQIVKTDAPEFDTCFYITVRDIGEPPEVLLNIQVESHLQIDDAAAVDEVE
jgi:hypothetical protein